MNAKTKDGITPLLDASLHGQTETVKILVERGADINAKDKWGHTALMNAERFGHTAIIQLLKNAGAKN